MKDRPTPPVLWTRGDGCSELAGLLGDATVRVVGDLADACVATRAELMVGRKLPGEFDLVNFAVPVDFAPTNVKAVAAAVGGGPHSALAAWVAGRLARTLGVPGVMASAYADAAGQGSALAIIERLAPEVPELEYRAVEAADMTALVRRLPDRALLVFGAPGGNWFQRLVFGPGARLRHRAPAGAVVVRQVPERVFQHMREPVYVGPWRQVGDTLLMHQEPALAVVEEGVLIGLVRRAALLDAGHAESVGSIMEEPLAVDRLEALSAADSLRVVYEEAPIPVVDQHHRMLGSLYPTAA